MVRSAARSFSLFVCAALDGSTPHGIFVSTATKTKKNQAAAATATALAWWMNQWALNIRLPHSCSLCVYAYQSGAIDNSNGLRNEKRKSRMKTITKRTIAHIKCTFKWNDINVSGDNKSASYAPLLTLDWIYLWYSGWTAAKWTKWVFEAVLHSKPWQRFRLKFIESELEYTIAIQFWYIQQIPSSFDAVR